LRIPGDLSVKPPLEGKPGAEGAPKTSKPASPPPNDRVEISQDSQRLKADADQAANEADNKLAKVQERIASGFYNREEVINHIAKRILDLLGLK